MPVPHERDAVERQLLRDTAYTALCDAIVEGTLAPGEQLHDAELCAWLGLSRTPVRDALTRLADEGLVELAPQRYTRVAPVEVEDVQATFPVLAVLHALATELAVPRLEAGDVDLLQRENEAFLQALAATDPKRAYAADDRFHDVFVRVAGNAEVERALARVTPRLHRLERLRGDTLPGRRSVAQHQAILARAVAGDAAGAAVATRANWLTLGALLAHAE